MFFNFDVGKKSCSDGKATLSSQDLPGSGLWDMLHTWVLVT